MKFKQLYIKYNNVDRRVEFSPKINLIKSIKNSVGKSTLLRLLFYAMGYPVPGTKGIQFSKVESELLIETKGTEYLLKRKDKELILSIEDKETLFILPNDLEELLSIVYGSGNNAIISNILGSIYLDQEKGWTLLNKGVVIGKIQFNLHQLVGGLGDREYSELELELYSVSKELKKYKTMEDLYEYKSTLLSEQNRYIKDDYLDELVKDLNILKIEMHSLKKQIRDMDQSVKNNNAFVKYIENMKLLIKVGNEEIPVTKESIVGFDDNQSLISTRKKMLEIQKSKIEKSIVETELEINKGNKLLDIKSEIEKFDFQVSNISINQTSLNKIISELNIRKNNLSKNIKDRITINNDVINSMYKTIKKYAEELEVAQYMDESKDFIFTNDLKSLSGAVLHKIVFIFKISYITEIEKYLGIRLPIVLDSPSGREVDQQNISGIMNILSRDFQNNQIIIASIYDDYGFSNINTIFIKNGLFR